MKHKKATRTAMFVSVLLIVAAVLAACTLGAGQGEKNNRIFFAGGEEQVIATFDALNSSDYADIAVKFVETAQHTEFMVSVDNAGTGSEEKLIKVGETQIFTVSGYNETTVKARPIGDGVGDSTFEVTQTRSETGAQQSPTPEIGIIPGDLVALRTPYVGDNSAVGKIVAALPLIDPNLEEVNFAFRDTIGGAELEKAAYTSRITINKEQATENLSNIGLSWDDFANNFENTVEKLYAQVSDGVSEPQVGAPNAEYQRVLDEIVGSIAYREDSNGEYLELAALQRAPYPEHISVIGSMNKHPQGTPDAFEIEPDYTAESSVTEGRTAATYYGYRLSNRRLESASLTVTFEDGAALTYPKLYTDWLKMREYEKFFAESLDTEVSESDIEAAKRAAQFYYDLLSTKWRGKVTERIENTDDYEPYIIPERVKGKITAFWAEGEPENPPRIIVLTQTTGGEWEVINEGY
jgi:hypothetical protein